jgi:hypothetical protein
MNRAENLNLTSLRLPRIASAKWVAHLYCESLLSKHNKTQLLITNY